MLKKALIIGLTGFGTPLFAAESAPPPITLYTPKVCITCIDYAEHLRKAGFVVTIKASDDMDAVKRRLKVPKDLESVPSATVGNYFVEGHVPADDIKELLRDKPKARGIAVPGLPMGAPGREYSAPICDTGCTVLDTDTSVEDRVRRELYNTLLVKPDGDTSVFNRH